MMDRCWYDGIKQGRRWLALLWIGLFFISPLIAQVRVSANVDRDRILIGEPILLSIEAYAPPGDSIVWFEADSLPHFHILEKFRIDTANETNGTKVSQLISITSFDSGRWEIPPFKVEVAGEPYYSAPLSIDVAFAAFDPAEDYRDIKDILEPPDPYARYILWAVALVALTALALLIYFLRRKKRLPPVPARAEPQLSPLEEARQAVNLLRRTRIKEGEEKNYYSKLNDIFRVFMLRRHGLSTLERTNDELIFQLSRLKMPEENFRRLEQSLRICDLVKFAKYRPGEKENRENLETVWSSIEILNNILMSSAV